MTTGLPARRALDTLLATDPAFVTLCQMIYGPSVDADAVWAQTFGKSDPGPTDVHMPSAAGGSQKRNWALRLGLAGTVAGGALAAREGAEGAARLAGRNIHKGRLVKMSADELKAPRRKTRAAGKATWGLGSLGADAVASSAVHRQQQVGKALGTGPIDTLARGALSQSRRVVAAMLGDGSGVGGAALKAGDTAGDAARLKTQTGRKRAGRTGKPAGASPAPGSGAVPGAGAGVSPKLGQGVPGSGTASSLGSVLGGGVNAMASHPGATAAGVGGLAAGNALGGAGGKQQHGYYQQPAYFTKSDPLDVTWEGSFAKFDVDKQLAFGWASVCKVDGEIVTDRQGDQIVPEDLEDAVYAYNVDGRVGGDMHLRTDGHTVYDQAFEKPGDWPVPVADLVESVMITAEKKKAMGLPDDYPEGWWVGFHYNDPATWREIKEGRRSGFSVHGKGVRVAA